MRIAFLPLDDRPITRDAFLALAAIAGCEVRTPDRECLGQLKTPADTDALWAWVNGPGAEADLLIASAELLIYGGLVPSRIGHEPLDRCLALAGRLADARRAAPHRRVLLAASNMRLPDAADATEEPEYWAEYGPQIFAHSFHADRAEQTGNSVERAQAEAALRGVPSAVLADVRARRARNLAVLLALVDLASRGVLEALLIGQDDAAEFGWTRRDLRAVESAIRDRGASSRAWVTYGTDELAVRLLARTVVADRGLRPGVEVVYSHPANRRSIPRYEGQAIDATVTSHIVTAGCRRVGSDPDLSLFVNNFPGEQEEAPDQKPYDPGLLDGFLARLSAAGEAARPCALADVRYSNGADATLVARLLGVPRAYGIRAYGGWNTMSNALGMALAQALLARGDGGRAFTVLRFLEDWGYQAVVRQRLIAEILPDYPTANAQDLGGKDPRGAYVACAAAARRWLEGSCVPPLEQCFGSRITIDRVDFPWRRLFNVDLAIRVE